MKHLVIGLGEVGVALQAVLGCDGHDKTITGSMKADMLHICFPYGKSFDAAVQSYRQHYNPKYVVIHSTVPIGTSKKLNAAHSPVRGVHPHLKKSLSIFIKYVGGTHADEIAREMRVHGIPAKAVKSSDDTEAMKLWDTTQYGLLILLEKEMHEFCKQHGLDFDTVYSDANRTYNAGYQRMGKPEVVRPYLSHMRGKIGGHCIVPNASLLRSESARRIINQNKKL